MQFPTPQPLHGSPTASTVKHLINNTSFKKNIQNTICLVISQLSIVLLFSSCTPEVAPDPIEQDIARKREILTRTTWEWIKIEPHFPHNMAMRWCLAFFPNGRFRSVSLVDTTQQGSRNGWRFEEDGKALWIPSMQTASSILYIQQLSDTLMILREESRDLPPNYVSAKHYLYFVPSTFKIEQP